jgi:dolichol-phosphate mannosyltransferase
LVSIVVPMKDEEGALPLLGREIEELRGLLAARGDELETILVDDGSTDGTAAAAQAWCDAGAGRRLIRHERNRGFGAGLRTGVAATTGDVVVSYDADCAYPARDVVRLLDVVAAGADVASATPFAPGAEFQSGPLRRLLSAGCSWCYRAALGGRARGVRTFSCAFRAYRGDLIRKLSWDADGFVAAAEIMSRALAAGAKVVESPSTLRGRETGASKMRVLPVALAHVSYLVGSFFGGGVAARGAERPDRRGTWRAALVAFAAAALVYLAVGRVTSFEFVNYDDVRLVSSENPAIGKGLVGGLSELLSPAARPQFMNAWLPLYYWSLGVDHALGGGAPWVFHLHSALLHALGAAMVAMIARRLGATTFVAGLAGVIFAVHPAATESVAWVASRKDVLSFVWMAAAAVFYLDGVAKRRPALHVVGAACLFVSLTAKGTTLVLPLLLVVHAFLIRDDETAPRARLAPVVPYALVAAVVTSVHMWVAAREGTAAVGAAAGVGGILVADLQVAWRYFVALFAPLPAVLSVEHGLVVGSTDVRQAVLGAALVVAWLVAVAATWGRARTAAAVLLALPLALLPFNNVLPRTSILFAERYCYVALLPAAIGAAWMLRPRGDGPGAFVPAAVGVGVLGTFAVLRLPAWSDSIALWEDASRKAPTSAVVQCQLAEAYGTKARGASAGDAAEFATRSIESWRSAKLLSKTDLDRLRAESGLATELLVGANLAKDPAQQVRDAAAGFESAAKLAETVDATGARAHRVIVLRSLATCREQLGDTPGAVAAWEQVVRIDDACAPAWNALARYYFSGGRQKEGVAALAKSAAADSKDAAVVRERARVRLAAGDLGGAKKDLAAAIAANPKDVELLIDAARLDAMMLRPVDAEAKLRKASELRPGDASIRDLLAAALLETAQSQAARDDMSAARESARKAAEAAPHSSAPEQVLGIVARRAGDLEEAARHLRKARELHPEGVRIREQLASVLVELGARLLDDQRESMAMIVLEEAVAVRAGVVATSKARLDVGVDDWPAPGPDDDRASVARRAALKGFAYLATGRASAAASELTVAEAGTRDGDVRLRRVVLLLLVRAHFAAGRADEAVAAAAEFPSIEIFEDAAWRWKRHDAYAIALVERGTGRRGAGDVAGSADDFRAARAALEAARAAGAPAAKLHVRLGEILFREEDFLAATKEFDRAEALSKTDLDPLLDRAAVWRTQYLLEEEKSFLAAAESDYRRAAEISASDPRVLAGLGETLFMAQRPSEAFPLLQKAVLADPSQSAARRLLAEIAIRAGRAHLEKCAGASAAVVKEELAEARTAAERAVAFDPPTPDALVFLGDVLRAGGDWSAPLGKYQLAHERFPDATAPIDAMAKFHMDRGNFLLLLYKKRAEAVADFRKAVDLRGTTIDVQPARDRLHEIAVAAFGEAIAFDEQDRPSEAADRFALSLAAEPTAETHFARGVVLSKADRLEDALPEYDAALRLNPKMHNARINAAGTLRRLGRLDEAAAAYRDWLDAAPADDPSRGRVMKQLEQIDAERRPDVDDK